MLIPAVLAESPLPLPPSSPVEPSLRSTAALVAWVDAAVAESRRMREQNRTLRERSRLLLAKSHRLNAGNRSLCAELRRRYAGTRTTQELILAAAAGAAPDALPSGAPPGPDTPVSASVRRPSIRSKLRFKHRWLISVDIVAALARAGVHCDIIVPGMDPVRDGYDPSLPKH